MFKFVWLFFPGDRMLDYMNMDDKSIGMFWVVSYTMAQPASETVVNWLSSAGVSELLTGTNMQSNERLMVMREVSPLPMSLLSGLSMNLCLKLVFQMEDSLFAGQVMLLVLAYVVVGNLAAGSTFICSLNACLQNWCIVQKPFVIQCNSCSITGKIWIRSKEQRHSKKEKKPPSFYYTNWSIQSHFEQRHGRKKRNDSFYYKDWCIQSHFRK